MKKFSLGQEILGNYISGSFKKVTDANGEWTCKSPAEITNEIGRVQYSYSSVEEAVQSARSAFSSWRQLSTADRIQLLKRYQSAIKKREDRFIEAIAFEVGTPLWEAKSEVTAMIHLVESTIQDSLKFIGELKIPKIMDNTMGVCRYRPLGVLAVIGPFNFSGYSPNSHIVPALLTGNTVVFKPSEKVPLMGQLIAECIHEAGFPNGVFNMIQGEREVGRRLCVHEGVNGILFTGSYEVGNRIKQDTLQQNWKLVVLEMGGKNPAIIWDDTQLDLAIYETIVGAFLSAGQRCTSTSRVIVQRKLLNEFLSKFHERAKSFSIGHPLDNPFMGPLIDHGSVDRYMKFIGIAVREGCELIMRGKTIDQESQGYYVTPSICLAKDLTLDQTKKSVYQQSELFGPNVAIIGADDLEHAIALANSTQYGLVASVFTQNRDIYLKCLDSLEMGMIHWNKSTGAFTSRLPMGGLKKSGNHFPTGLLAPLYCTTPVSSLEVAEPQEIPNSISQVSGLNWD